MRTTNSPRHRLFRAPLLAALVMTLCTLTLPQSAAAQQNFSDRVQSMYVAYYGRPGDPGGIDYWSQRLNESGGDLAAIIDAFGNSAEYSERFGVLDNRALVNNIFSQLFGRDADPAGLAFYVGRLDTGAMTLASIALNIADGVQTGTDDAAIVANRMQVANSYSTAVRDDQFSYDNNQIETARQLLADIASDEASRLAGLAIVAGIHRTAPTEPGTVNDGRLQAMLAYVQSQYDLPAMGVILVRAGQVSEIATSGVRVRGGNEPVTDANLWHLGSLTKSMTATLAAALVESGMISWQSTPAQIFPELIGSMNPAYENVTIAQLLAHQSGLPVDMTNIPSFDRVADTAAGTTREKRLLWARELLATTPQNAVGEFSYSNSGYVVAGAMLEAASGTSWEDLLTQQVLQPLGMNQTGFGPPGSATLRDQPWGHSANGNILSARSPDSAGADNPAAVGPAGTVHASLRDYAKYMLAHINGELGQPELLTADSYRFLHAPFEGKDYGMGWGVDNSIPAIGAILEHTGSNLRWIAQVGLVPQMGIGVLVVTNAAGNKAQQAVDAMGNLMFQRIMASP
jgi:D-alanyl-D-alanine carboxypeptidase